MIKYGNLSFPQFAKMVIAESKVEFSNQDQWDQVGDSYLDTPWKPF